MKKKPTTTLQQPKTLADDTDLLRAMNAAIEQWPTHMGAAPTLLRRAMGRIAKLEKRLAEQGEKKKEVEIEFDRVRAMRCPVCHKRIGAPMSVMNATLPGVLTVCCKDCGVDWSVMAIWSGKGDDKISRLIPDSEKIGAWFRDERTGVVVIKGGVDFAATEWDATVIAPGAVTLPEAEQATSSYDGDEDDADMDDPAYDDDFLPIPVFRMDGWEKGA